MSAIAVSPVSWRLPSAQFANKPFGLSQKMRLIATELAECVRLGEENVERPAESALLSPDAARGALVSHPDQRTRVGRHTNRSGPQDAVIMPPRLLMARPRDQRLLEPRQPLQSPQDGSKVVGERFGERIRNREVRHHALPQSRKVIRPLAVDQRQHSARHGLAGLRRR